MDYILSKCVYVSSNMKICNENAIYGFCRKHSRMIDRKIRFAHKSMWLQYYCLIQGN